MLFEYALTTTIMRLSASAAADFFVTFARKVGSVRMGELVRLSASAAADFFVMLARKVDVICGCNKLELNNLVKLEFRHNGSIITSAMISVISARKRHDALGCSGDQGPATASVYSHTLRVCRCVCVQVCLCVCVGAAFFGDIHHPKRNLVRKCVHLHSLLDLCLDCVMLLHHKTKGWNTHSWTQPRRHTGPGKGSSSGRSERQGRRGPHARRRHSRGGL